MGFQHGFNGITKFYYLDSRNALFIIIYWARQNALIKILISEELAFQQLVIKTVPPLEILHRYAVTRRNSGSFFNRPCLPIVNMIILNWID